MNIFAQRLRDLLEEKDITQKELANSLDITEVTISRYLNSERQPRIDIVEKIANFFKVSTDYLIGTSDIKRPYDDDPNMLPEEFTNPADAMTFILKQPSVMAYGGYSLNDMSEEEILDFANDILIAIKITLAQRKKK